MSGFHGARFTEPDGSPTTQARMFMAGLAHVERVDDAPPTDPDLSTFYIRVAAGAIDRVWLGNALIFTA